MPSPVWGRARRPAPEPSSLSAFTATANVGTVAIWKVAKTVGKQKARDATPAVEGGRPNKSLIAVVLAAGAGALALLRGRRSTSD